MIVTSQRVGSFWKKNASPLSTKMDLEEPDIYFCDQETQPYYISGEGKAHLMLFIEQQKQVTIIIDRTQTSFNELDVKVHCGRQSKCTLIEYGLCEGMTSISAKVEEEASFEAYPFYVNTQKSEHEWVCHLMGSRAHGAVEGGWYLKGEEQLYINVLMHHLNKDTTSRQLLKGVVTDGSYSHFKGSILIGQGGSGSDAYQANHNLVCSSDARATTEPGLDIYKEDVKASHGATVCTVKDEDLFYCRSRGLSKELALQWKIRAHLQEVVDKNPSTSIQNHWQSELNRLIESEHAL